MALGLPPAQSLVFQKILPPSRAEYGPEGVLPLKATARKGNSSSPADKLGLGGP